MSCGEVLAVPRALHFAFERVDGAVESGVGAGRRFEGDGYGGPQHAGVGTVVAAHGRAQAAVGDAVSPSEGDALDEAAQVILRPVVLALEAHQVDALVGLRLSLASN